MLHQNKQMPSVVMAAQTEIIECSPPSPPKPTISKEKNQLAKKRWKLLINVLTKRKQAVDPSVSVRRFASFGLLHTEVVDCDSETMTCFDGTAAERRHIWYRYTSPYCPQYSAEIRHLDGTLDVSDILGFNNTGNVCVWPSEEMLTHYCLLNSDIFKNKSVCELGGGMTCLAGTAVAQCSEAAEVLLTDGNDNSVQNVKCVIERNISKFGTTNVKARVLRWNELEEDLKGKYDIVICADCLFFDEYRADLAQVISLLLKPGGQVIMFAPSRGTTFLDFVKLIESNFENISHVEKHDDMIWNLHNQNLTKGTEVYDPNLHYPMMLTFTKKS